MNDQNLPIRDLLQCRHDASERLQEAAAHRWSLDKRSLSH